MNSRRLRSPYRFASHMQRHWFTSALAWDGVLPWLVACLPFMASLALPRNDGAVIFAILVVPLVAALVRASLAWSQITRACGGRAPAWRQVLLAGAIIALLAFEIFAGMLSKAPDEPLWTWSIAIVLYLIYLSALLLALRPSYAHRRPTNHLVI